MQRPEIEHLVREKGRTISTLPGVNSSTVIGLVARINGVIKTHASEGVTNARDMFELCQMLDLLEIPESLRDHVQEARREIGGSILETLADGRRSALKRGETARATEFSNQAGLERGVWGLIQELRTQKPEGTFTPTWIETNAREVYKKLIEVIRNRSTQVFEWERVKALLPKDLAERFVLDSLMPTEEKIAMNVKEYEDIAKKLGPEVLAQFLISIQKAGNLKFDQVLRIIAKHLGRCNIDTFNLHDFKELPDAVIQLTGVKEVIFLHLRNALYRRLLETLPDTATAEDYSRALESIEAEALTLIEPSRETHYALLGELIQYFQEILRIEVPSRMKPTIVDKKGVEHAFPSLRQRIAMKGMKDGHRKLVSFFMGSGKTATAFLSKEHVGAKKMLYICPPNLVKQTKERVEKYYKTDGAPSVGIIDSNLPDKDEAERRTRAGEMVETLDQVLKKEVVVIPYSMFGSSRDDQSIQESIKQAGFDFVVIDEAHLAKNESGTNAEVILNFVSEIPKLYEEGYVMSMTGEPIPNTPNDIITQLRIYDKDQYGDVSTLAQCLKKTDPLVLRNALLDYMILIDPPEDWENYVKYEGYDLYEEERRLYQAIWENDELNFSEKLKALSLAVLNPSLFSGTEMASSLADQCAEKTKEYLQTNDCVLIAENEFKKGVTRPHESVPHVETFVDKLKASLGTEAEVHIIDGDTPLAERERIIALSKQKDGVKRVIFAMSSTVREGIDLSHIHRAIVLEPNFNKPDLAQLVKRFQREGNTDVEVTCFMARDTVQQGIQEHANYKADLGQRFKYGGTLTADEASYFEGSGQDLKDDVHILERKLTIGSAIMDKLLTDRHKLHRALAYLHGGGAEKCREFVAYAGKEFAEWYSQNWMASYSGNNGRFVAGLAQKLEENGLITASDPTKGITYGDIACGPLVLENTLGAHPDRKRQICSFDINPHQLQAGLQRYKEMRGEDAQEPAIMGTGEMHNLKLESLDVLNSSLAIHYTRLNVNAHPQNDERVKTLVEFNRVLRAGGVMMLTIPSNVGTVDERTAFMEQLAHFGFEVQNDYCGTGQSVDETDGRVFQNFTMVCRKTGVPRLEALEMKKLKLSRIKTNHTGAGGSKTKEQVPTGSIHTEFELSGTGFSYEDGAESAKEAQQNVDGMIKEARSILVGIYGKNGNTFEGLSREDQDNLKSEGITLSRLSIGKGRQDWIFSLVGGSTSQFVFQD